MFLDYFALLMLFLSITAIVYLFIYIHDLPYMTAKARNHPNQEAIHYACWLSLFTLHAIWPFIYIWAVVKKTPYPIEVINSGTGLTSNAPDLTTHGKEKTSHATDNTNNGADLKVAIEHLQSRVKDLEQALKNRSHNA